MPVTERNWTRAQARLYQLHATGLHGVPFAAGAEGIAACFARLGSVQLDPLPILGRNHDLVIQTRVPGTHPGDLLDLVHRERLGFEYWDKMLCLIALDDYPLFRGDRSYAADGWTERRVRDLEAKHPGTLDAVRAAVGRHGPLSSRELGELDVAQQEHRGWKSTRAANLALDALWNRGVLAVSHRVHFRRYFDLAERVIPRTCRARRPPGPEARLRALLLRRVRVVGLLAERGNADAWSGLQVARAAGLAETMAAEGALVKVRPAGSATAYYAAADAEEALAAAERARPDPAVRFIAPLDPLMWGRHTLRDLWGFDYVWEVYKPAPARRYGYYVLGVLRGTEFVGRFDGRFDRDAGTLRVLSYRPEPGGPTIDDPGVQQAFRRFMEYLGAAHLSLPRTRAARRQAGRGGKADPGG